MGRLNWEQGSFQRIKNLNPVIEKMLETLFHDFIYWSLVYKPFNNFIPREYERYERNQGREAEQICGANNMCHMYLYIKRSIVSDHLYFIMLQGWLLEK